MARLTWNVFIQNSGDIYTADGTIYRPNETLEIPKISTEIKTRLSTGLNAFVTPLNKSIFEPIILIWLELTDSNFNNLRTKLIDYMDAQSTIKIIDHNNVNYIGHFISVKQIWISGVEDTEDLEAIFEREE